jgi:hypothetical protein
MKPPAPCRRISLLLLLTLSPFAFDGCVSIGVERRPALEVQAPTGVLEVSLYEKSSDHDSGHLVRYPVFAELHRIDGGKETAVGRSMAPAWSLLALPPGRYRLDVSKKIDDAGGIVPLAHPGSKKFDLKAGETTSLNVVLEKVPTLWIILAVVTIVALLVIGIDAASKGKLPMPPIPPLPPGMGFVAVSFAFPVGLREDAGNGPAAADVFPAKGSVVSARRVTVNFLVSMPLRENGIADGAVIALGTKSGEIEGTVSYRAEEQLVRFIPSRNFTPGEAVTVTLDLEKLTGVDGSNGKGRFSTSFTVPAPKE